MGLFTFTTPGQFSLKLRPGLTMEKMKQPLTGFAEITIQTPKTKDELPACYIVFC